MKQKDTKKKAVKATAKKGKTKGAPAKVAEKAATPKRTPMDIPAAKLRHAPWNPRAKITPESVADLTASIRKDGLIQRLVVVKDGSHYAVVAGNRRLVACREAALDPIPCEVMDVTQDQARRITLLENLQRKDVDPLLESDLIDKLISDGMTQAEIAAETGRGERWVARRKNLRNLSPGWRKRVEKGERFTTDCLEHIAAYPTELQEKLKDTDVYDDDAPIAWYVIKDDFERESRDLEDAKFNTAQCRSCTNNTGCCPDLFDLDGKKNAQLGQCLCEKCWREKSAAHVADTIAKAEKKGVQMVRNEPWNCSVYRYGFQKSKELNTLYVFKDRDGEMQYRWGLPPVNKTSSASAGSDESEAKLKEKSEKRERNKAIRKLAAICGGGDAGEPCNLANWLDTFFYDKDMANGIARYAPFIVMHLFHGLESYCMQGSNTDMHDAAAAFCIGKWDIPKHWSRLVAPRIIRELDPSRCDGYRAVPNAQLICAMFPAEVTSGTGGLTDEEVALIKGKSDPLTEMEVEWDDPDRDADEKDDGDADDDADWDQEAEM